MNPYFMRHKRPSASNAAFAMGLVVTVWSSAVMLGQGTPVSPHLANATLDVVDVGQDAPPGRLTGFGPPEPQTHGGSWGGAPSGRFYRVLWFEGDEPLGIVELTIPPHTVAQKVEIDYLNGISGCFGSPSGDTFEVDAANRMNPLRWTAIGTVVWDPSACTVGEQERAAVLYLRASDEQEGVSLGGGNKGKELFLKLTSAAGITGQPWTLFTTFGQVGVHSVRLVGKVTGNNR